MKNLKNNIALFIITIFITSCSVDIEKYKNAADYGDFEFIKENTQKLPDDKKDEVLEYCLNTSISKSNWEIANYLLDNGATGTTASLCKAILKRNEDFVFKMLNKNSELGTETYYDENIYDGATPLQYALSSKQEKIALKLIENGANAANAGSKYYPPIWLAAETNSVPVIKKILSKHKNIVNMANIEGETAILPAIKNNNYEIVKILINNGADISVAKKTETLKNATENIKELILSSAKD